MCCFNTISLGDIAIEQVDYFPSTLQGEIRRLHPNIINRLNTIKRVNSRAASTALAIDHLFYVDNQFVYVHSKAQICYEVDNDDWDSIMKEFDVLMNKVIRDSWLLVSLKYATSKYLNTDYNNIC